MLVFQVFGGGTWELSEAQLAQWQDEIYPDMDVARECRKAWAWIDANPKRRKTAKGMKKFLVAWLNRAEPSSVERPDDRGHVPPCRTVGECTARVLAEARAGK